MPKWAPANNDVPSVADLVAYIADQVISQVTAATNPSGTAGETIYEMDTTRYKGHDGSGFVQFGGLTATALNSHNPTIDQGATTNIGKTILYSEFQRLGNMCFWWFALSITGTGTAGSIFTLSLPVTSASAASAVGAGRFFDSSATQSYDGSFLVVTTTTVARFYVTVASTQAAGVAPNVALGSGDALHGFMVIPVA